MKILWVKSDFLHPTNKGGLIRTLGMLRCLHQRHEVHYVGFRAPGETEGVARANEYSTRAYPIDFEATDKMSWKFGVQLAKGLLDPVPLAVSRYRSEKMRRLLSELMERERFDRVICDFLVPSVNFPSMNGVVLFQHNVETMIWRRRVEHARNLAERRYLQLQADRMFAYERKICHAAAGVIAVSQVDAKMMEDMFDLSEVGHVPTGVDLEYFARPEQMEVPELDLVFVGSMDWAPNVDGIEYFVRAILPRIRAERPGTRLAVVGRNPSPAMRNLAAADPDIEVTGTVPDVRPYLWGAKASIVPLRIGGGTRLKIYEAMAAGTPTVSTRVGAEGIDAEHPVSIRLADEPQAFAAECLELLQQPDIRARMANAALRLVKQNYSWEMVTRKFETLLEKTTDSPQLAS